MLYKELRALLRSKDIEHRYLGEKILGHCPAYVSTRMTGKYPWALDEAYTILDATNTPHDQLHYYFPPGGVSSKKEPQLPAIDEDAICAKVFALLGEALDSARRAV